MPGHQGVLRQTQGPHRRLQEEAGLPDEGATLARTRQTLLPGQR